MIKPNIWIIDTSVFMNILDVEGFNQDRGIILKEFGSRIEDKDIFFLPFVVLIETGNHIAQLNGNIKFTKAQEFVKFVKSALNGQTPFIPLRFPEKEDLLNWIDGFPEKAAQEIGFGDFSIIKDWEEQSNLSQGWSVKIWSLDAGLQGYAS
ncbi:hypothetical protein J2X69_005137 [Algoriphagus sp. 4150]|uniref:hypothetical protein n=1 Tax=Algoriphagus sp. 4150 TaxID=2817756 RepID=UPI00286246C2|nr:hypothetical protein [Algoriphagus sp. 4150]MDR7132763.1 hypothetical protein [Algoriphagus sp. 4150]